MKGSTYGGALPLITKVIQLWFRKNLTALRSDLR